MGVSFGIVWGVALLVIVGLALLLALTLRPETRTKPDRGSGSKEIGSVHDTLLFDFEEQSVRSTTHGHVTIRIPGAAWKADWREDLIRVEVNEMDLDAVGLPSEWSGAKVLAAYEIVAYRMAETGIDVEIERFEAPVDIIVASERTDRGLSLLVQQRDEWSSATATAMPSADLRNKDLPVGWLRLGRSVTELGRVCLVQMSEPDQTLS